MGRSVPLATTAESRVSVGKLASVALPCVVFLLHASVFRSWIVDDAGISFAYARNLATGHGLVSQPGLPPVEGYSNPLWVFLMGVLYRLHLFVIPYTPKIVSAVLVMAAFAIIGRMAERPWATGVTLTLLALNTSFVVWTVSGLENALYVFLVVALACCCRQAIAQPHAPHLTAATLGVLVTAAALTRPEGVIYATAFPLLLLLSRVYRQHRGTAALAPPLAIYALTFAATFGAFLLFRWRYFGEIVPNTYYAKGTAYFGGAAHNTYPTPPALTRALELVSSAGGWPLLWMPVGLAAVVYLIVRRRLGLTQLVVGGMLALSALVYLLLPPDWMMEYRFATPFHVFCYLFVVLVTRDFVTSLQLSPQTRRGVAFTLAGLAVVVSWLGFSMRTAVFVRQPEVDFDGVKQWISDRVDWYAEALGLEQASALVPDMGATLWYSRLRLYDLGKLCDKTIAKTMEKDQQAFYDYIFEVAKPTIIHTHGSWTWYSRFDDDPRFRRDYAPIWERQDGWGEKGPIYSGDFVRKEVVHGREEVMEQLRETWWR